MNTDGKIKAVTVLILGLLAIARAESVRVTWSPSPSPDVVSYRIYYGTNSGAYPFVTVTGTNCECTVELPWSGRWFFAATAVNAIGVESDFSNEAQWESKPMPPVVQGVAMVRLVPVFERSTNCLDWSEVIGAPTWIASTNEAEFFRVARLTMERAKQP
jgi:hypothetical protein